MSSLQHLRLRKPRSQGKNGVGQDAHGGVCRRDGTVRVRYPHPSSHLDRSTTNLRSSAAEDCPCYTATEEYRPWCYALMSGLCALDCPTILATSTITIPTTNPVCPKTTTYSFELSCPNNCDEVECSTITHSEVGSYKCGSTITGGRSTTCYTNPIVTVTPAPDNKEDVNGQAIPQTFRA